MDVVKTQAKALVQETKKKGSVRDSLSLALLFQTHVFRLFRVYSVECVHVIPNSALEHLGILQAH